MYQVLRSLHQLCDIKISVVFTGSLTGTATITVVCCQHSQLKKMLKLLEINDLPSKLMDPLSSMHEVQVKKLLALRESNNLIFNIYMQKYLS